MISLSDNLVMFQERFKDKIKPILSNAILREESPVDEFYCVSLECSNEKREVVFHHDPLFELFNQQRIGRIGSTALETWIKSMMVLKSNPLAELREKCTDSELLSIMKSRYCQTPSEVMSWAKYLNNNLKELENQVTLAREEQERLNAAAQVENNTATVAAADGAAQVN